MNINERANSAIQRWLPLAAILTVVVVCAWQVFHVIGKMFDGPLSQDSIVAQEERLNSQAFTSFEVWRSTAKSLPTVDPSLRDPFGS